MLGVKDIEAKRAWLKYFLKASLEMKGFSVCVDGDLGPAHAR